MTVSPWLGRPAVDLDTPALLIDVPALEGNLEAMRALAAAAGIAYRPHGKAHKSPVLAHKQLRAGASGLCCATLGEAEVMAAGGVGDILITSEVMGAGKLRRLMSLARHVPVMVVVDHERNVADLSTAAQAAGVRLGVLVEVDVGQGRCGTVPDAPAVALARQIARAAGLAFRGPPRPLLRRARQRRGSGLGDPGPREVPLIRSLRRQRLSPSQSKAKTLTR